MREILFRGKSGDKWIYGYYWTNRVGNHFIRVVENKAGHFISPVDDEIDPETLCQYTGLKDKNGERIFEGDVVRLKIEDDRDYETDGYVEAKICYIIEKEYDNPAYCGFGLQVLESDKWFKKGETFLRQEDLNFDNSLFETEIIGNIHDNKDLIGE
jgi:uncharacterized phage protein (TIGR01671 family)